MPQISSTDRLVLDGNDMTDELTHSHPDVQFTALLQLATIFKNKFQKPLAPELVQAPVK
jgi:hypothetical protein